jgi:hypothetical protein
MHEAAKSFPDDQQLSFLIQAYSTFFNNRTKPASKVNGGIIFVVLVALSSSTKKRTMKSKDPTSNHR